MVQISGGGGGDKACQLGAREKVSPGAFVYKHVSLQIQASIFALPSHCFLFTFLCCSSCLSRNNARHFCFPCLERIFLDTLNIAKKINLNCFNFLAYCKNGCTFGLHPRRG